MFDRSRFGAGRGQPQGSPCGPSIADVAQAAGIQLTGAGPKRPIRCPFHDDQHPSAFVDCNRGVFYCSVCTHDRGWSARRFAAALGQIGYCPAEYPPRSGAHSTRAFTPVDAQSTWTQAVARARDDGSCEADFPVFDYLIRRGLADAWEESAFGVLSDNMVLHDAIQGWPESGHRIIGPLYDERGRLCNVQARSIGARSPKTLFPRGSKATGLVFASRTGLAVLRRLWSGPKIVVLGEGLSDYLALLLTSPVPVLSVPGAAMATQAIGGWIAGFDVLMALDNDRAGEAAIQPTANAAFDFGARSVRRVVWPGRVKDACDVVRDRGIAALAAVLTREMEHFAHA